MVSQSRCFAYVGDVVRAVIALSDSPAALGQVFNIGSTEEVTIEALARRTVALAGSRSELVYIPYDQAYEEGFEDMQRRVPDTRKVHGLVGWHADRRSGWHSEARYRGDAARSAWRERPC